jgi:DNA-binding MarR family transcriptional regulator
LQRRGLVARSRSREDRRVMKTRLTAAGLARVLALDRPIEEFELQLLGHLGKHRQRALIDLLEAVQRASG